MPPVFFHERRCKGHMRSVLNSIQPGIAAALGAALLFGAGTPLAKVLLAHANPWLLAGLLYLGSGIGLTVYRWYRHRHMPTIQAGEWRWLAGAVIAGGLVAPVLLMFGLRNMPASGASLLLNAEGVFTVLGAWLIFRENFDRRILLGVIAIVAGAVVVSWPAEVRFGAIWPALAVLGACLAWGIDNNLTRKVSLVDATWVASVKGLSAGAVNLLLALIIGASWPSVPAVGDALLVGWLAYGVSLALFIIGLRNLGTARTSAYFSIAPFVGAILAVPLLHEALSAKLLAGGILMAIGLWLHLSERHSHVHTHEPMEHEHEHEHDEHHQHGHEVPIAPGTRHSHLHRHEALTHSHPHFPDAHHRHNH